MWNPRYKGNAKKAIYKETTKRESQDKKEPQKGKHMMWGKHKT